MSSLSTRPLQMSVWCLLFGLATVLSACNGAAPEPDAATPVISDCTPSGGRVMWTGASFEIGEANAYREEQPVRTVTVGDFAIDRIEVTNARFA